MLIPTKLGNLATKHGRNTIKSSANIIMAIKESKQSTIYRERERDSRKNSGTENLNEI